VASSLARAAAVSTGLQATKRPDKVNILLVDDQPARLLSYETILGELRGIVRADIVLIGVSRTSKTPLSQYLAHHRYKVANVPIVPEVDPPEELFRIPSKKCIGLKIDPDTLNHIRKERLKTLGLDGSASYATIERIKYELDYFNQIAERLDCKVIDVTNKAVEETANIIMDEMRK